MTKLHISADIALPLDAVTQTFAILAKRRVGKTYTGSVMAEEMVARSLPFVVLDPTGAWWGLRASADGKAEGLPVVIVGGAHGDIPLEPTAGKVIADLVVDHPGFYVVDLSETESDAAQDRFAEEFATRLYRRKEKQRDPLHLFIDEADMFAPQRPFPNQTKMLGAFEALVRRGGIRGIGMTMITQRPAVLNKNVLTQVECLIVLQMTAPQDQDAVEDWIKRNGTKEQRDTLMASLASLKRGEAWIWSPSWLDVFKKIHIRERNTFNSSATPKAGEKQIQPQRLAPVDLEKLRDRIAETIERAKADDPKELRRQIADLQKQLRARPTQTPSQVETKTERVEVPIILAEDIGKLEQIAALDTARLEQWQAVLSEIKTAGEDINHAIEVRRDVLARLAALITSAKQPARPSTSPISARAVTPIRLTDRLSHQVRHPDTVDATHLNPGETKVLIAAAQYPEGVTMEQLAVLTNYRKTSRETYTKTLASRGLIVKDRGLFKITNAGMEALPEGFEPLPTGTELQEYWLRELKGGEKKIFQVVLSAYPEEIDLQSIMDATGYKKTSVDTYLKELRARKLVTRESGRARASDELFKVK